MNLITPAEAWERLEEHLRPLPSESVPRRQADGRVLAHPLAARVDFPAFDVSAMDGYALRGGVAAGDRRPVTGTVAAGDPPGDELPEGAAMRIMTGAPVPDGADTVVPVELTESADDEVRFTADGAAGLHIRRRGEIQRADAQLLPAGTVLTPAMLSLLASHGHVGISVHRRPTVRFLSTGNEVVPPEEEPLPGQLRDSHSDFLLAAGGRLGLDFESLGIAPDRPDVLRDKIRHGLNADVLIVCGGVSMGEFDFVGSTVEELGCDVLLDGVALQPGKPLVVARHESGWVFGLPGNPASVMVTFRLFVRPLLRRLMGHEDGYFEGALNGRLAAPLAGAKDRDRFLPAEVETADGELFVRPLTAKGSHDLAAYALGHALVHIPPGAEPAPAGAPCTVLPLD